MKFIVGNWKMNGSQKHIRSFMEILSQHTFSQNQIILCFPYVYLPLAREICQQTSFKIGAQNLYYQTAGPFTGEVSAMMLKDIGCSYVIVGHSERRSNFHETDEDIGKKAIAASQAELIPIICVGETWIEKEQGKTIERVLTQLKAVLTHPLNKFMIAYEPVWAIGSGQTPTLQEIEGIHQEIKSHYNVPILYGGSVNEKNSQSLLAIKEIDGLLVGTASLDASTFASVASNS